MLLKDSLSSYHDVANLKKMYAEIPQFIVKKVASAERALYEGFGHNMRIEHRKIQVSKGIYNKLLQI